MTIDFKTLKAMRGYDVSKFRGEVPSEADEVVYEREMVKFISYYAAILQAERGGALGGLNQAWSWLACTLNEPAGSPSKREKCYPAVVLRFLETVAWQMGRAFQNQFHRIVAQVRLCVCLRVFTCILRVCVFYVCVCVVPACWCFGICAWAQVRCWMVVGCITQVRCRLLYLAVCCRAPPTFSYHRKSPLPLSFPLFNLSFPRTRCATNSCLNLHRPMRLFFRPLFTSYEHGAITISRNKEGSICQTGISGLSRLKRYRLSRTIRKYTQNKKQHVMVIEDSLHLDAARARRAAMTPPLPPPLP